MSAPGAVARRQDVVRQLRGEIGHVVALVAVLGERLAEAQRRDRCAEDADLAARIVEVVLARHALAAGLEDAAEQVADERAARIADVQRAGRIGRHELDVDRARLARRLCSGPTRRAPRGRRAMTSSRALSASVRFTKPGGATVALAIGVAPRRGRLGGQFRRQGRGDRERRHPVRAGQLHREVGGEVAVLLAGRSFDLDRGRRRVRRAAAAASRRRWRSSRHARWRSRARSRMGGRLVMGRTS